jgi:transposase
MGTNQGFTPWQNHRLRSDGEGQPSVYRGGAVDCANGQPVARLDSALGNWHATYTRFSRWGKKGVWQRIIAAIRHDEKEGQILYRA